MPCSHPLTQMPYEASSLRWTSSSYIPSSASSLHRTYCHCLKTVMRSEAYFKSKKKDLYFFTTQKSITETTSNQKSSLLTTLLSAEEEELDEEEQDEE
jgi:DNA-binding LytR/AlgR family response regulator